MINKYTILAGLMMVPAIHASADMHDWECRYIIEDTRSHCVYYTDWYVLQEDNSVCLIDLASGKVWLPAGSFTIHTNPNA